MDGECGLFGGGWDLFVQTSFLRSAEILQLENGLLYLSNDNSGQDEGGLIDIMIMENCWFYMFWGSVDGKCTVWRILGSLDGDCFFEGFWEFIDGEIIIKWSFKKHWPCGRWRGFILRVLACLRSLGILWIINVTLLWLVLLFGPW